MVTSLTKHSHSADPAPGTHNEHFQLLGYNRGVYYYLPRATGQLVELKVDQHVESRLIGLVPDENFWRAEYGTKEGVSWRMARADLLRRQNLVGVYDPARVRGRGAWWDRDHAIVHVGDRLLINGKSHPLSYPSRHIYEASIPYPISAENPLDARSSYALIEACKLISWEKPINAYYLAGWIALAPVGGALNWRPHIWITAAAESGKSWVMRELVGRILQGIAVGSQSCTTEPAIRGELNHGSLPVIFDEAESKTKTEKIRMDAVVGLARAASTEGGDPIRKSNPDGSVRKTFIRSMFAFSSISYPLTKPEDLRRITPLSIVKDGNIARFEQLKTFVQTHITDDFCARLPARSIKMIATIRANYKVFGAALVDKFKSQGMADQYGMLVAGAWALFPDKIATAAEAEAWVAARDADESWTEHRVQQEDSDEIQCLAHILQYVVRATTTHGSVDISVAELMKISSGGADDLRQEWAAGTLGRLGLRGDPDIMVISSNHSGIANILKDTAWARNWARTLRRLPGASITEHPVRFGFVRGRGVELPYPD